jgi:hypothetical protein
MTMEAESNAGAEKNACHAYAKRAPAASARICLSPQPGRRDHSVMAVTAAASITRIVSVRSTAVGKCGAITTMLAATAEAMLTTQAGGAGREAWAAGRSGRRMVSRMPAMIKTTARIAATISRLGGARIGMWPRSSQRRQ